MRTTYGFFRAFRCVQVSRPAENWGRCGVALQPERLAGYAPSYRIAPGRTQSSTHTAFRCKHLSPPEPPTSMPTHANGHRSRSEQRRYRVDRAAHGSRDKDDSPDSYSARQPNVSLHLGDSL